MNRKEVLARVSAEIGDRNLMWMGAVGLDARPLLDVPQFSHCFSLHAGLESEQVDGFSVETYTGKRGGGDYEVEFNRELTMKLIQWLGTATDKPCLVIGQLPSPEIEMLQAMSPRFQNLGIPVSSYHAFSDKAAVEAALASHPAIKVMPWRQMPSDGSRRQELRKALQDGPIVVRSSTRQSGGSGHELIRDEQELASSVVVGRDEMISVAPYLTGYFHVGVGGCVFRDGVTTLHVPGAGLIGLPLCTPYKFGYAGNDYGLIGRLKPPALDMLEAVVHAVGKWLHSKGYVGAYGLQGLINDDELYYAEISPRFGGKSRISADLDKALDLPDIYLDHLMAWLGMDSYTTSPLKEIVAMQPHFSQIHCRNLADGPLRLSETGMKLPEGFTAELVPAPVISVAPGALLCTLRTEQSVTSDGYSLTDDATRAVKAALDAFHPA